MDLVPEIAEGIDAMGFPDEAAEMVDGADFIAAGLLELFTVEEEDFIALAFEGGGSDEGNALMLEGSFFTFVLIAEVMTWKEKRKRR